MKILLNFYPVQAGGGQQVASNFIKLISNDNFGHEWFVFVGEGSELQELSKKFFHDKNILAIKYSYSNRLFNKLKLNKYISQNKLDIIYNFAPILPVKGLPQVVRSVYSNLYFPEIDFWGTLSTAKKIEKKIIDYLRLKGTLKAEGLIFENKAMQARSNELFKYPLNKTVYIHPSVTSFDEESKNEEYNFLTELQEFKILYLSSWYENKNIIILPLVAKNLEKNGVRCKFILTLNPNDPDVKSRLIKKIIDLGVIEFFTFIDKVKAIHVHQVVKSCNAMILLSKLECFSSNIVEAYTFKKPLIISDEIWARESCHNAAFYVDRNDEIKIAKSIETLIKNDLLQIQLVKSGTELLSEFNTPLEKVKKQVLFLEKIHEEYQISN